MTTTDEIRDRHAHHPPTQESIRLHEEIRSRGTDFAIALNMILPESREKSLALTAVQEATMWANAAVAIHVSGQSSPPPTEVPEAALAAVEERSKEMVCNGCNEPMQMLDSPVNGSLNPHWDGRRFSCQNVVDEP